MTELPPSVVQEKVLKFETFINDVLKEDLKKVHQEWDRTTTEIAEWIQLKNTVQSFLDMEITTFKAKVDIGSNVFAQAVVPDTSRILLCEGAGVYVEYTLQESIKVIENKLKHLEKQLETIKDTSNTVKARIKLVLHGIQELQGIK